MNEIILICHVYYAIIYKRSTLILQRRVETEMSIVELKMRFFVMFHHARAWFFFYFFLIFFFFIFTRQSCFEFFLFTSLMPLNVTALLHFKFIKLFLKKKKKHLYYHKYIACSIKMNRTCELALT